MSSGGVDYYNEIEPFAIEWLENLIAAGELPAGTVDKRSVVDVQAQDLKGYTACHFFAGIGGWPYALRLAEWPKGVPVWTGSCPCQPLSSAGKQLGERDERHLWPAWFDLIEECRPATIFGEQVASADGREWLAGVRADLEGLGYAFGAADLCAAGASAPHSRQRLFWVADANGVEFRGEPCARQQPLNEQDRGTGRVGDDHGQRQGSVGGVQEGPATDRQRTVGGLAEPEGLRRRQGGRRTTNEVGTEARNGSRLGDSCGAGFPRREGEPGDDGSQRQAAQRTGRDALRVGQPDGSGLEQDDRSQQTGANAAHWDNATIIACQDGKARRVESGVFRWLMGYSVAWDQNSPGWKNWSFAQQKLTDEEG